MSARLRSLNRNWVVLCCACVLSIACSSEPNSPEQEIRDLLSQLETASEGKRIESLRDAVADEYWDERGNDKRAIERILRFYFLRNESIHLLTRIQSLVLSKTERADAVIMVAMAGTPITSVDALPSINVDLHRFDVALEKQGDAWQVTSAKWRRANVDDFL